MVRKAPALNKKLATNRNPSIPPLSLTAYDGGTNLLNHALRTHALQHMAALEFARIAHWGSTFEAISYLNAPL